MSDAAAAPQQPQEDPITTLDQLGAKWESFAWKDCTTEYDAQVQSMEAWEHRIIHGISVEEIMSAPEIMDVKTDLHHNWKETKPLEVLEKTKGALLDVAKLSDAELIDLMDSHFTTEQQLFADNNDPVSTILYSAFAHKADLVKGNDVLKAWMDAFYYDVLASLARVGTSQVADEDEFPLLEQAVDVLSKRNVSAGLKVDELKKNLLDAKGKTKNADIIARLEHRLASLEFAVLISATDIPEDATLASSEVNADALAKCAYVISKIDAINRKKNDEVVTLNPKVFMDACFSWLRISIPNKGVKTCDFARAKSLGTKMHNEYSTVLRAFPMKDLLTTVHEFEAINTARFTLASRALLSVIVSRQVGHDDWKELILRSLDTYGIPIIRKLLEGDKNLLHEVLSYRVGQGFAQTIKPDDEKAFLENVEQIVVRLAISVHDFLRVMAQHRALTNRNIAAMFQRTWDIMDAAMSYDNVFGTRPVRQPLAQQSHDVKAARVFFNWASVLYTFAYGYYVNTTADLELSTKAEFFGILFLKIQACRDMQECQASLVYTKGQAVPKKHNKMGNIPAVSPIVYTRRNVEVENDAPTLGRMDIRTQMEAHICQAALLVGGLLEKHDLIEFKLPKASLVSVEDVFNHRFGSVLGQTARIPFYGLDFVNKQKIEMTTEVSKNAKGNLKKVFGDYTKSLGGAATMLKKTYPGIEAQDVELVDQYFANLYQCFLTFQAALDVIIANWAEDKTPAENAANLKDSYTFDVSFSQFGIPKVSAEKK